jgi:heme/copper-type cytochrome/quinol oxidase subunit 3
MIANLAVTFVLVLVGFVVLSLTGNERVTLALVASGIAYTWAVVAIEKHGRKLVSLVIYLVKTMSQTM